MNCNQNILKAEKDQYVNNLKLSPKTLKNVPEL